MRPKRDQSAVDGESGQGIQCQLRKADLSGIECDNDSAIM